MTDRDREKVLHSLEDEISRAEQYDTEWNDCVPVWVFRGAYELLKEQEPVVPQKHYNENADLLYDCGMVRIPTVYYDQIIDALKEPEPILLENQHKPYGISTNANSPWVSRCPKCGKKVEGKQTRFCKYCGQAVKWNDGE